MKRNIILYTFFCVVLLLFYLINQSLPFMVDDWQDFGFIWNENGEIDYNRPMHSYHDILTSQWMLYLHWGGRYLIHTLACLFIHQWGDVAFDLFNTGSFALLIFSLGKLTAPQDILINQLWLGIIGLCMVAILSGSSFPCMYIGAAFSVNYIFAPAICLYWLYLYRYCDIKNKYSKTIFAIFSFVAGWSMELFAVAVGAYAFLYTTLNFKNMQKNKIIHFIFFAAGACLLIFAPGNFERRVHDVSVPTVYWGLLFFWFCNYTLLIFAICITSLHFFSRYNIRNYFKISKTNETLYLLFAWLISIVFVSITKPTYFFDQRMLFGVEYLGVIIILRYILKYYSDIYCLLFKYVVSICVAFFILLVYYQYPIGKEYKTFFAQCLDKEKTNVSFGFKDISVPSFICSYIICHNATIRDNTYSEIFHKEVCVYDDYDKTCFSKFNKVPGDNPFYESNLYLYSKQPLPSEIQVNVLLEEPQHNDLVSLFKRTVTKFYPRKKQKCVVQHLDIHKVNIDGNTFYRTDHNIMKDSYRKVKYISIIDGNTK